MSWTKRIAVLAAVSTALSMLLAGVGSAVSQAVPSNTSLPSIGGSAKDGSVLTADHGTWTDSPQSYAYAWERCDTAGGTCASIAGATSKQYTVITADVGHRLRVVVTATNSSGSGTATSRPTGIVAATGQAPKNTAAPTIAGTAKENSTLTVDKGTWTGTQPITFAYQWQRCDATGGSCGRGSTVASSQETGIVVPATPGHTLAIGMVSPPNRLIVDNVKFEPSLLASRAAFTARFHVSDTRGFAIQGALVYALGLPYGWVGNAAEVTTDASGWATISMQPSGAMPLRPGALVIFVRARKPGDNLLAGVSTRRLVQVSIR